MPSRPVRIPDAMPEIKKPMLLLVCDTHRCTFIDAGGHRLVEQEVVESKEETFTDHQGSMRSPASMGKGGGISGVGDLTQVEKNRLRDFANVVSKRLDTVIRSLKIQDLHVAAPGRFLSVLKTHLSKEAIGKLRSVLDGNFVKEPLTKILLRFRPDLKQSLEALREEENYSPKKHLPKQGKRS